MATTTHPSSKVGAERICPTTGKQFKWTWTKATAFDVCDQCNDGKLPPVRLSELNQKRKTEKETISRFGMSEAARIMER